MIMYWDYLHETHGSVPYFLRETHVFGYRRMQVVTSPCLAFPPQNTEVGAHFLAHLPWF
jgi:hypothetical protein